MKRHITTPQQQKHSQFLLLKLWSIVVACCCVIATYNSFDRLPSHFFGNTDSNFISNRGCTKACFVFKDWTFDRFHAKWTISNFSQVRRFERAKKPIAIAKCVLKSQPEVCFWFPLVGQQILSSSLFRFYPNNIRRQISFPPPSFFSKSSLRIVLKTKKHSNTTKLSKLTMESQFIDVIGILRKQVRLSSFGRKLTAACQVEKGLPPSVMMGHLLDFAHEIDSIALSDCKNDS